MFAPRLEEAGQLILIREAGARDDLADISEESELVQDGVILVEAAVVRTFDRRVRDKDGLADRVTADRLQEVGEALIVVFRPTSWPAWWALIRVQHRR